MGLEGSNNPGLIITLLGFKHKLLGSGVASGIGTQDHSISCLALKQLNETVSNLPLLLFRNFVKKSSVGCFYFISQGILSILFWDGVMAE